MKNSTARPMVPAWRMAQQAVLAATAVCAGMWVCGRLFLWFCGLLDPTVWLAFDGGFRVWAWTGRALPPFIDAAGPWDAVETRSWLRDEDVVLATGTKSGTTWMLYTAHLIRTHGDEAQFPFVDPMYNTPWMEQQQRPGQTWTERKAAWNATRVPQQCPPLLQRGSSPDNWRGWCSGDRGGNEGLECCGQCCGTIGTSDGQRPNASAGACNLRCFWDHPAYPFRIFKSHLTPRTDRGGGGGEEGGEGRGGGAGFLPVRERPGVKFVAMVRNGLDVVASRIPFHEAFSPAFRAMWGGYPPIAGPDATVRAPRARLLLLHSAGSCTGTCTGTCCGQSVRG